jgi:hypothetical protein
MASVNALSSISLSTSPCSRAANRGDIASHAATKSTTLDPPNGAPLAGVICSSIVGRLALVDAPSALSARSERSSSTLARGRGARGRRPRDDATSPRRARIRGARVARAAPRGLARASRDAGVMCAASRAARVARARRRLRRAPDKRATPRRRRTT